MSINTINFSDGGSTKYYIGEPFSILHSLHPIEKSILLIDENVYNLHALKFDKYVFIKIKASEENKVQLTVDDIIAQMLELNIDKSWMLIGVGGGVVTDIAGYVASIYKRGIQFGLVSTSILGMTDAAIGGKNGVNVGIYKNMVGTMHRANFILFDFDFLDSLPKNEWINGFAEILKHACIRDAGMFYELENHTIDFYFENRLEIASLIEKNIHIKTAVVLKDEFENDERYILNFGHTFGHAIENEHQLPHGFAVSIGMVIAAKISEEINGFFTEDKERIVKMLEKYGLPTTINFDLKNTFNLLKKDKKVIGQSINFVLLNKIGEASVQKIPFSNLESIVDKF